MEKKIRFYLFTIPVVVASLFAILAIAGVGSVSQWSWWVFPLIAFGPILLLVGFAAIKVFLVQFVPPKLDGGEYDYHAVEYGMTKPIVFWRWQKEAIEYRKWLKNFHIQVARRKEEARIASMATKSDEIGE